MRSPFDPQPWAVDAACNDADPELFFYAEQERGPDREARDAEAKAICAACPVLAECLDYITRTEMVSGRYGVWGGTTPDERAEAHRQRLRARRTAVAS